MATYQIQEGDTFELISRRFYGTEFEEGLLRTANPDISGDLPVGANIFVPNNPFVPDNLPVGESQTADEVSLSIDNQRFRFWESITINRSIDKTSTVEFTAPWEPDVPFFRSTFSPMTFKNIGVTVGSDPLFTGIMLSSKPSVTPNRSSLTVSCYSSAGVLNDSTLPASLFPLEFNNQTLKQICAACCKPFGVKVSSDGFGKSFERVAAKPEEKVLQFLVSLAGQRNTIVSDTPLGELLIQQSVDAGNPVARIETGASPVVSVSPNFSPQQYFSHVTGIQPVAPGLDGAKYTVKNTLSSGFLRPATFAANDAQSGDLKTTVEAKTGRMFANTISYQVELNTWRTPNGQLWEPNTTVSLLAPDAMIYNHYEFLIRNVVLRANANQRTATLTLTLPGAFKGQIPESLPWD
jgi:prophage tail gpP-like protein